MYRPAKPRWDYFALPVLYGDQLVGKADTRADPKGRGVLVVNAVHQDVPFTTTMTASRDQQSRPRRLAHARSTPRGRGRRPSPRRGAVACRYPPRAHARLISLGRIAQLVAQA